MKSYFKDSCDKCKKEIESSTLCFHQPFGDNIVSKIKFLHCAGDLGRYKGSAFLCRDCFVDRLRDILIIEDRAKNDKKFNKNILHLVDD